MADILFNKKELDLAVDLALIDMRKKYIQKILDLYAKIKPNNEYNNTIYTIKFYDGSREKIKTFTKDVWEFYDPEDEAPAINICEACKKDLVLEFINEKFN
jgi:hypothetical protein